MAETIERTPLIDPSPPPGRDADLVELMGRDDPIDPRNSMSSWRKSLSAMLLGAMTFAATFSSSVFVAVGPALARELDSSAQEITLATTLFIFGFAAGPIIMGPASEVYGRKMPLFLGYLVFVLCQIPVARAQSMKTILLWRFVGGVASSACPAIVGGCLADFLFPVERGVAVAIFAATTLIGPSAGAIVGSALIQDSTLGWRWGAWLSLILGALFGAAAYVVVPETYVPVLLHRKAQRLRVETGDWALHTKADETPLTLSSFASRYLSRPFAMLLHEPILWLMTLYVSFTFGMMYFLFVVRLKMSAFCFDTVLMARLTTQAYAFSFIQERGLSPFEGSLPLLAVVVGIILGSIYVTHYTLKTYSRKFKNDKRVSPEDRLPPMTVGGAVLPIGLLWFAATSSQQYQVLFWLQAVSGVAIGAGIQIVTLQTLAYVLDIYTINANSAMSGLVIVRSLLGGLFPLVAVPMYEKLGVSSVQNHILKG